jgi:ankyrin repeat protein
MFRFLLASLHLESLKGKRTEGHIEEALQTLPKGADALSMAYKSVVERIDNYERDDRNWAQRVLSWIVYVKRPLSPTELRHALAIREGDREFKTKYLPSLGEVISLCAGLVTLNDKSNVVQLVHYTAQQYFEDRQHQPKWIRAASTDIATTCITYLSFDTFEAGFCPTDEEFETRLQQYPLYDYSARNWGYHACVASIEEEQLILNLLKSGAKVSAANQAMMASGRYSNYSQNVPRQVTGAHLAAYFGLSETIIALLRNGHDPNIQDGDGWTPLSRAAANGHEAVVKLLLDKVSVDPDSKDKYGRTPLRWAAEKGHEAVAKLLLNKEGVDPDSKDKYGWTPLLGAAEKGHEAVVKLLLDKEGVDSDSKDKYGRTPLRWAAEKGHEAVVKLLLDKEGVDPDSKDKYGWTPLLGAAEKGHEAVVKLLLDKEGVDPDCKDNNGWTPLRGAAEKGHEAVIKLLLDKEGVDPDSKDKYGWTPLGAAAEKGHEAVVNLLLDKEGIDPDCKDKHGWTPLRGAAEKGHKTVVRLLQSRCTLSL